MISPLCTLVICHLIHLLPPQSVSENWERSFTRPLMLSLSLSRTPHPCKSRYKASFYLQPSPPSPTMIVGLLGGGLRSTWGSAQVSFRLCLATKKIAPAADAGLTLLHSGARMCEQAQGHNKLSATDQNCPKKTSCVLHQSVAKRTVLYYC